MFNSVLSPWRQRHYNQWRETDSWRLFAQKTFESGDKPAPVRDGFVQILVLKSHTLMTGGTLTQSPGSLAGDVIHGVCQELITDPRGSEKRQEVCERNSKEVS